MGLLMNGFCSFCIKGRALSCIVLPTSVIFVKDSPFLIADTFNHSLTPFGKERPLSVVAFFFCGVNLKSIDNQYLNGVRLRCKGDERNAYEQHRG